MNIFLTAISPDLLSAWSEFCRDLPNVFLFKGSIFKTPVDALVSPANSLGFMDGGIDREYTRRFGFGLQAELQRQIKNLPNQRLPIGDALIIPTKNKQHRYIISAPTMEVPMSLAVGTRNPFLAACAAIRIALVNKLAAIAFPGLGTGIGGVSAQDCAKQMREAILTFP